jgi:hypothetical protein
MEDIKNAIRIADRIRDVLLRLRHSRYLELARRLSSLGKELQDLTAVSKKMTTALAHDWLSAANDCCQSADRLLSDIPYCVSRIKQLTEVPQKDVPTLSALVEDLDELQEELGNWEFDNESGAISVTTDPITLEDVGLGPFRIQLEIGKLAELYYASPYRVIALEPNPASTDQSVTHPHVNGERLCEGDGSPAIQAALEEGRLCDFFTIVRSILNTYCPDSPYVPLADWDGETCNECGYSMSSDNSYCCSSCENSVCEECSSFCRSCQETICLGCAAKCEVCEEPVCPRCARVKCTECQTVCCESCIADGLCPDCREERKAEDEERREQVAGTEENRGSSEPNTDSEQVKLAS